MPAQQEKKKGSNLEEAVKLIQEAILASNPNLKGTHFLAERNKIVNVGGARHEIDVFVQTSPGALYEATFIFECKDWAEPVGIEPVHVLANKVETIRANRGFLVARQLTTDARALLQANPKLRFVRCSNEFAGPLSTAVLFHSVREPLARTVSLRFRGIPPSEHPAKLDWEGKTCRFNNHDVKFRAIIEPWFDNLVAVDTKQYEAKYVNEGTHPSTIARRIEFPAGQFYFDGMDVEYMEIQGCYFVTVTKRQPCFKFELDGQGRAISFEPMLDVLPGTTLQIHVVQRL